jgi:hypothetical protein
MPKAAALNFSNPSLKGRKGEDKSPSPKQKADRPDRQGKKLVATHLPTAAYIDLRILAAKLATTQAALIEEALTDLMHKYKDRL